MQSTMGRWFEHGVTRAVLAYYCPVGTFAGPKTPGSAYVVLHHIMGEHEGAGGWGFVRGGMGAISEAIAECGLRHGMTIRTQAEVSQVEVVNDQVSKVVTSNGDEYTARAVVSNASCKVLFQGLVAPEHLPGDFLKHIGDYKTFSTAFKINVAAEAPPNYAAFDAARCGFDAPNYAHIGPDIDYLQAAYEDACEGRYSGKPFITAVVPTTVDDALAPKGKQVINLFGGHAPYELKGKSWDTEREGFIKNVYDTMDEVAPGFSDGIIDAQVLLPPDIERIINSPHGHIFHGELSLEQLFFQRAAQQKWHAGSFSRLQRTGNWRLKITWSAITASRRIRNIAKWKSRLISPVMAHPQHWSVLPGVMNPGAHRRNSREPAQVAAQSGRSIFRLVNMAHELVTPVSHWPIKLALFATYFVFTLMLRPGGLSKRLNPRMMVQIPLQRPCCSSDHSHNRV
jgi:hypothetical protein